MELTKHEKVIILGGLMALYQTTGIKNKDVIEDYDKNVFAEATVDLEAEEANEIVKELTNKLYNDLKENS